MMAFPDDKDIAIIIGILVGLGILLGVGLTLLIQYLL